MGLIPRLPAPPLDSWFWTVWETWVYAAPAPAPRTPRAAPMAVLAVGLSRSGTESLSRALEQLGYPTYHGWDLLLETPTRMPQWKALARRKYYGRVGLDDGAADITAEDFDAILGHATAVSDMAAYYFCPELVRAYPGAKVILNQRPDAERWAASVEKNIVPIAESWLFWLSSWFEYKSFWTYHFGIRWFVNMWYSFPMGDSTAGMRHCMHWRARDHCNMVRGLVPADNLLEWSVEDGWEPLCEFLGRPVPDAPFPRSNASGAEFDRKGSQTTNGAPRRVARNMLLSAAALAAAVYLARNPAGAATRARGFVAARWLRR